MKWPRPTVDFVRQRNSIVGRAVVALLCVGGGVLLRIPFEPWLHGFYPFATFYPAVLLAALIGGLLSGALALTIGGALALALFGSTLYFAGGLIWILSAALVVWSGSTIRDLHLRLDQTAQELRRADDQKALLLREFAHRTQNAFTMVMALFAESARQSGSVAQLKEKFSTRVNALAASKRLLIDNIGRLVRLEAVIHAGIDPFLKTFGERIRIVTVDEPMIAGDLCTDITLILHELAANAVKHGALSTPSGRVTIESRSTTGNEHQICWTESGGPPVKAPDRLGFGTQLINSALRPRGGSTEISFSPGGVVCLIKFKTEGGARAYARSVA